MDEELDATTVTREALYQLVWSEAVSKVCKRFGLSDNGLRKICRRHQIPTPGNGYWAKLQHGKPVERAPLPACDDDELEVVVLEERRTVSSEAPAGPDYDAEVAGLLDKARKLPRVGVPTALRAPHPLVRATKTALERAEPDQYGLIAPRRIDGSDTLSMRVGKNSIGRALRFFDALIKAVERLGGRVRIEGDRWNRRTAVLFDGEEAAGIRVRERYTQKKKVRKDTGRYSWHEYEYTPNGMLLLDSGPSSYHAPYCADAERRGTIENCVNEALIRIIEDYGFKRNREREWAEQERQQAERQRQREEVERQRKMEEARRQQLVAEAEQWRTARLVREYVAAVKVRVLTDVGEIDPESELETWIEWASAHADRLDPLVGKPG